MANSDILAQEHKSVTFFATGALLMRASIGHMTTKRLLHFLIALGNILNGITAIFTRK